MTFLFETCLINHSTYTYNIIKFLDTMSIFKEIYFHFNHLQIQRRKSNIALLVKRNFTGVRILLYEEILIMKVLYVMLIHFVLHYDWKFTFPLM